MKWSGTETFVKTNMTSFTVDGEEAGLIKSYGPLSFLKVRTRHILSVDLFACCLTYNKSLFINYIIMWLI